MSPTIVTVEEAEARLRELIGLAAQGEEVVISSENQPKVKLVPATRDTVMNEIADADAFIGEVSPEMVRAGKNLKWVAVM